MVIDRAVLQPLRHPAGLEMAGPDRVYGGHDVPAIWMIVASDGSAWWPRTRLMLRDFARLGGPQRATKGHLLRP